MIFQICPDPKNQVPYGSMFFFLGSFLLPNAGGSTTINMSEDARNHKIGGGMNHLNQQQKADVT